MVSTDLFRVRIVTLLKNVHGGVDLQEVGVDASGLEWAVKRAAGHVAVTEHVGYHLFETLQLAVPYHGILELPDGQTAFGSRFEGGVIDPVTLGPAGLSARLSACAGSISSALALDMWLGNEDRHAHNFVWRPGAGSRVVPMPIDFGRAFLVRGWPLQDLRDASCNTTSLISILRHMKVWRTNIALATLSNLGTIDGSTIARWLENVPEDWLAVDMRQILLDWWGSAEFFQRIQNCTEFCS